MAGRFTGQSIERREDERLLRGAGTFAAANSKAGMAHAVFVRSTHAHARITRIDALDACALPGVVAVITGADVIEAMTGPMVLVGPPSLKIAPFWPLATDKVRYVGDPIAVVVAETPAIAADAAELVDVHYEPLAPVVTMDHAAAATSAPLWDELETNVASEGVMTWGDVDAVFAAADRVVTRRYVQHRISHAPMEPRSAIAAYDAGSGKFEYEASHKRPHPLKMTFSQLLGVPFPDVHVSTGDIGGGFGSKGQITRDDVALAATAKILGRPVKWVETRGENLMVAGHAREETLEVDAAVDTDGRVRGLRVRMQLDAGAYPMLPFPASFFSTLVAMLLPNAYRIEAYSFDSTVVYTNKASYISYRGPWAVETWVREAILDAVGRELDITPEEMRRRNLFSAEHLPAHTTTGISLSSITARETLERAVDLMDLEGFRAAEVQGARGRPVDRPRVRHVHRDRAGPARLRETGRVRPPRRDRVGAHRADRARHGVDLAGVAGPKPRDHDRPGGGRRDGRAHRDGAHRRGRLGDHAVEHDVDRRLAGIHHGIGRGGRRHPHGQGHGPRHRRQHARSQRSRPRDRRLDHQRARHPDQVGRPRRRRACRVVRAVVTPRRPAPGPRGHV